MATGGGGGEEGGGGASVEGAGAGVTCFDFLSSTEETVGVACNVDEDLESCLTATGWTLSCNTETRLGWLISPWRFDTGEDSSVECLKFSG